MYPDLSRVEKYAYFIAWISTVLYSICNLYIAGSYFDNSYVHNNVFKPGWHFLGRMKDVTDIEWNAWDLFIYSAIPWQMVHLVGAEIIRREDRAILPVWYLTFSMMFLIYLCGPLATAYLYILPIILYGCVKLKSRAVIWVICFLILLGSREYIYVMSLRGKIDYNLILCLHWLVLRMVSFCVDKISGSCKNSSLINFLAYCFYMPVLIFGPMILYDRFEEGISKPFVKWTVHRLKAVVFRFGRYLGWWLFIELCKHYFYFSAWRYHLKLDNIGTWTLFGLGYCMAQLFMIKYVVIYGISCAVAHIEQIEAPNHPKCIARVHLYSYMWRNFDQGLYFFLRKYIYIPCLGSNPSHIRKIWASLVTFFFIFFWHNILLFVFIWATMNFLCVTIEGIFKNVGSSSVYKKWEKQLMSERNARRFHALIASPLFILSFSSNMYFIAGLKVGNMFFSHIYNNSLISNCLIIILGYFCCQVSIEITNWEARRKEKNALKKLD